MTMKNKTKKSFEDLLEKKQELEQTKNLLDLAYAKYISMRLEENEKDEKKK